MHGAAERLATRVCVAGSGLAALLSAHTFVNSWFVRRADPMAGPVEAETRVSVLIPARNEALRIGPTIASVLACDGVANLEVLVLDDHSTDDTAGVVREAANGDMRVRVIPGKTLPAGWMGKPWACQQLGDAATGSILVFLDADVTLEPAAICATVDLLQRFDLSLVSPYPKQVADTPGERLVQPLLQWLWLTFLPLRLAERPKPVSMAAANGQVLAVVASAYRSVGGHASVREQVIEDVELAKAFKAAGHRAGVAEGSEIVTCRMYENWGELQEGYSKSLWAALPSQTAARGAGVLLTLAFVVPPLSLVAGLVTRSTRLSLVGGAGYVAGVLGRIISARTTGGSVADAAAHPGSILALLWLGGRSRRKLQRGELQWKGRAVTK
jgi:Glycosyl transferase family 2